MTALYETTMLNAEMIQEVSRFGVELTNPHTNIA